MCGWASAILTVEQFAESAFPAGRAMMGAVYPQKFLIQLSAAIVLSVAAAGLLKRRILFLLAIIPLVYLIVLVILILNGEA
jgi:hypothetical protein